MARKPYEVVYIFDPALDEETINSKLSHFHTLVQVEGADAPELNHWGKRTLAYHIKRPRPVVKMTRKEVLQRDEHMCQYCGKKGDLTLDHIVPRHQGGQHTWENVVAACRSCNHKKGGRTLAESKMQLLRAPKRPPATPTYLYSSYVRGGEQSWAKFIGLDEAAS